MPPTARLGTCTEDTIESWPCEGSARLQKTLLKQQAVEFTSAFRLSLDITESVKTHQQTSFVYPDSPRGMNAYTVARQHGR